MSELSLLDFIDEEEQEVPGSSSMDEKETSEETPTEDGTTIAEANIDKVEDEGERLLNSLRNQLFIAYKSTYEFYSSPVNNPPQQLKKWADKVEKKFGNLRKEQQALKDWFINLTLEELKEIKDELKGHFASWKMYSFYMVSIEETIAKIEKRAKAKK